MSITKVFLFVSVLLLLNSVGYSQDIIFFKDGTKDSVKVLEIGIDLIAYKKFKRLNGPLYKVEKGKVILIEFEDGTIETIKAPIKKDDKVDNYSILKKRNIFSINTFGLFLTNIHLGYENISADGTFGIKINAALSPIFLIDEGLAVFGADFNFYPYGQKKVSYFLGPSFRLGAFEEIPFTAVVFNNGFAYNAKSGFYLGGQFGIGPGLVFDDEPIPYGFLMLNIGGRF